MRYFGSLIVLKLRSRALPAQVIEEIRQETFLRVLVAVRKEGGIRDGSKLGAFVNTTCNHVLSEHFRKDSRYTMLDPGHAELPAETDGIEQELMRQDVRRKVRDVLSQLSDRDRGILNALFLEERGKDAVCEQFGVGRDYLRVLLHRAKNSFRAVLKKSAGQ
ncbi:MAG: sigma-70 family RNA polymerase sigma factor [Bryobacterales bacterium]|nr:sigma-70 family RNA polymerase sigma factor [Bryobacterales bacterium]